MKKLILLMMVLLVGSLAGCSDKDDGMLKISSDPGDAEIYIDGERKGNTPAKKGQTFAIKLSEGDHTIEIIKPIENPGKYDQYYATRKVFLAEKTLQTVSLELEKRQTKLHKEKLRLESEARKEELERQRKAREEEQERQNKARKEKLQAACDAVNDYKVNGDGTVSDKETGLMWKQCPEGLSGSSCNNGKAKEYNWDAAMALAKQLSFAGYSDWRLPSKDELLSIAHQECGRPTINSLVFPNTKDSWYWSASPYTDLASYAWAVHFDDANDNGNYKSRNNYVRLVRGGQ